MQRLGRNRCQDPAEYAVAVGVIFVLLVGITRVLLAV
jgi:hypothetical protein